MTHAKSRRVPSLTWSNNSIKHVAYKPIPDVGGGGCFNGVYRRPDRNIFVTSILFSAFPTGKNSVGRPDAAVGAHRKPAAAGRGRHNGPRLTAFCKPWVTGSVYSPFANASRKDGGRSLPVLSRSLKRASAVEMGGYKTALVNL